MYKRLVVLSAIILAALCGLASLGYHSVRIWASGMEGTRLGEFAAVAEQIRQDVSRKLDEFVQREQSRPYTDYQYYYVPDNVIAAQEQRMPLLRSPLAGKLQEGLAYGQFQIEPDGTIITPNDDTQAAEGADRDNEFYTKLYLNKENVRSNLLPALVQVRAGGSSGARFDANAVPLPDEIQLYDQIQVAANESPQKPGGKAKGPQGFRGKNLSIDSFQNPDQKAQVINRSRAVIEQDFVSNSPAAPQQQVASGPAQADAQPQSDKPSQAGASTVAPPDEISEAAAVYSVRSGETGLAEKVKDLEKKGESLRQSQTPKGSEQQKSERQPAPPTQPAQMRQAADHYVGTEMAQTQTESTQRHRAAGPPIAQQNEEPPESPTPGQPSLPYDVSLDAAQAGQMPSTQEYQSEMVQVRIEPFVPMLIPGKGGEQSIFGGQVFMLRHVQIENKHLIQGFQLNEKELIQQVEESAKKFVRGWMGFELARKANGGSAYAAILDFGFGRLVLNLIETDPFHIARKISQMRNWYFSIITVVLLAVALALASLWHNARAQLRLARKKDDFISAVSHELRTPLTSIRMYSEMLEKNWVSSKEKVAEYYKNMRQESERLSRLIENVLDFSRIQRGRKKYAFNLGNLNKCIADVVEMMRPYAAQHGFTIQTQLAELGQTAFDADAVTQIIVNLLDNAVKYARNAEDKTVTIRTGTDGRFVLIEVEDHGPGVPHRQRKKIFEEFYRVGAEATRETTGTGLGLALVKKFAQAHNGFVEILSARPSGAVFRVGLAARM
jgi:signal transduction histidine kinase